MEKTIKNTTEEFIDFHAAELLTPAIFNSKMIDYLVWYNTRRVHGAFQNKLSPVQVILSLQENNFNLPQECNLGWTYTLSLQKV